MFILFVLTEEEGGGTQLSMVVYLIPVEVSVREPSQTVEISEEQAEVASLCILTKSTFRPVEGHTNFPSVTLEGFAASLGVRCWGP